MKKIFYISITTVFSILMVSCKKDFLEKLPNEDLSTEQISEAAKQDPSLLNGSIAGLYATMYTEYTGGTSGDDDFGQKSYDLFSDILSADVAVGGVTYGWYSGIAQLQPTRDFTRNEAYMPWRYYYRIIFGANNVIDALGGTDAVPTATAQKHIMGQAKAMRAYAYFYLTQLYAREGYGTGNEKILPLYKTVSNNVPLSTSAEIYSLIIDDLTKAVDYLSDFNRRSKDQIDQSVAKGLLAYALSARGTNADLQQVVTLTNDIIEDYDYRLTNQDETVARFDANGNVINSQSGFNNVATPSWMWGVDITIASNVDITSWWGAFDVFTYGYPSVGDTKVIDENLYNTMRPDDIRRGQFDDLPQFGLTGLIPINKFFDPGRQLDGQLNVTTDYIYMRVDEFYLLNAEANAKLNQDAPARARLKQLLNLRLTNGTAYVDALSGQALRNEIYLQTRLELWGEGKSYLAMKRNKATVTRGPNHLFLDGQSFAYNSVDLTFPIPQAEVINNPLLNQ
ncbi:RagB/SusD family nutrient uptake outer membrane protein [Pedobacter aquae]|uniref:RagB/SusD family nutrient uptake outer membrane protein n=1 Tax=Pedobacter aquae TaxID=2605747 RepID=A0A5C0VJR4_9SPHI|nr:RagB/SusD family nutrient uptake outer membrane protein [Pedobacter aquae]QEK52329.1 RagB/SusD family nutrient uptake outer membrane protein [Pedobacter aquae]